jgi:hypothetical protein
MEAIGSDAIFGGTSIAEAAKVEKKPAAKKSTRRGAAMKTVVNKAAKKATETTTTADIKTAEAANATKETTKEGTDAKVVLADAKETSVKAEVKTEVKTKAKTATKKAAKTGTKKAAKAKTADKAAAADKPKRKYTRKTSTSVFIEYQGQQIDYDAVVKKVQDDCKERDLKAKALNLYIKPEDNACYYTVDDGVEGQVVLY